MLPTLHQWKVGQVGKTDWKYVCSVFDRTNGKGYLNRGERGWDASENVLKVWIGAFLGQMLFGTWGPIFVLSHQWSHDFIIIFEGAIVLTC